MITGCNKDENTGSGSGVGNYYVDGKKVNINSAQLDIDSSGQGDSTQIKNTLALYGTDGSTVKLEFKGDNEGLRSPLSASLPRGVFTDIQGFEHESLSGNLDITKYQKKNGNRTISGDFEFTAQALNGSGEVRLNNGEFELRTK